MLDAILASALNDTIGLNRQFLANVFPRETLDRAAAAAPIKLLRIAAVWGLKAEATAMLPTSGRKSAELIVRDTASSLATLGSSSAISISPSEITAVWQRHASVS